MLIFYHGAHFVNSKEHENICQLFAGREVEEHMF